MASRANAIPPIIVFLKKCLLSLLIAVFLLLLCVIKMLYRVVNGPLILKAVIRPFALKMIRQNDDDHRGHPHSKFTTTSFLRCTQFNCPSALSGANVHRILPGQYTPELSHQHIQDQRISDVYPSHPSVTPSDTLTRIPFLVCRRIRDNYVML